MNTKQTPAMLKFLKISGLFSLLCCVHILSLNAQDDTCIRFEDLPADAVYGREANQSPGDLAFSSKGVDVYLEEFRYSNSNEIGFWNVSVEKDIFGPQSALEGQSLFVSNINLKFDFTQLDQAVNGLCFQIVDGGGEENISVNGEEIKVIPDFSDVPQEIAPGVFISVNPLPDPIDNFPFNAEICLRGPIKELLIGGQEFALDNLCFFHEPCTLSDLEVEIVDCAAPSEDVFNYTLVVDFLLPSTTNTNFDLYINNSFRGFYSTADLPLKLDQIRVLSEQESFEVTVCVNDRPDCCITQEIANPGCQPTCNIEQVEIGEIECGSDGFYYTRIEVKGANLSGALQITNEAGETWFGNLDGNELVKFPIPSQQYDKWTICDPQYPNCCYTIDFDVPCPTCRIGPLQAEATECNDDGMFFIKLDFDHLTPTGQFYVFVNGEEYTAQAYTNLPLRLGPFPAEGLNGYKIRVIDASEQCEQETYLEPVSCPPYNCEIGALKIYEKECLDSGEFYFTLDFDHARTTEKFQLLLNQDVYESYAYADLPVRVGPLTADGTTDWHILVKDSEGPCAGETKFEAIDCTPNECEMGPLQLSEPICNENGTFFFKLDFEHKNNSDLFKIYLNGELYEQYTYQELPVSIGPLPADGTTNWHIIVEDEVGNCAEDAKLDVVNCNPKTCSIGELKLSEAICADDGQFYFELNFEYANTSDKFQLLLNQEVYESYSYADLPVKVGPLPANTDFDWHILVRDLSNNTDTSPCASDTKISSVNCPGGDCKISELYLKETYCTDDGKEFYTFLDFQHEGTSDQFKLFLNDELYGNFAYDELPLKLGPFNALIDLEWKLLVKDESGNCGEDLYFSAPDCDGSSECNLSNLKIERYPCIGGQFLVDLFFDIKDPGAKGYYVFTNGQISGPYSYDQPHITLGPFAGDGSTIYDFLVIDIANPSCYDYYELGPVDCSTPCTISDVEAEIKDCGPDGGFLVDVRFNYDKVGASGFIIAANEVEFGPFDYGQEVYSIGPLAGDGNTVYDILVIDQDNPDCQNFTVIEPVDCLPCNIGELEYTVNCINNSQKFVLNLNFEYENPESERFILAIGDQVVGSFPYNNLPLSQELELPETGELIVSVWDSEDESCAQKAEFSIPCCYLSDPVLEVHPCENDGELWVDIDLKYYNVSNTFQLVYGPKGGNLQIAEYPYSDLPITLGPLPGQSDTEWYFEVTDLGFFCQSSTEITTEYCNNDACAEWDQTPLGAYGPLTGYEPGDLIDEEDGLQLSFAPTNPDNCNCSVFLTRATTFPTFAAGNGQVVLLDNSGALINAPGYEIQSLIVDYYFTGNEALLKVNDQPLVGAGHPADLPSAIAPGVKLEVIPTSNDGRSGQMIFTGTIYRLSLLSRGKWVLDNFCTEKAEKEDEVWPGDTNLDNVANHIDLLNIGLGFGEQGPPRVNANLSWEAQSAEDWSNLFFDNDLNLKHADANGDGQINRADRAPIMEHYGLTHGPLPVFVAVPATENDPPLYVDFDTGNTPIPVGGTFQVPIIFGTEALPVEDIYGIAFSITFDPAVIDPASIEVVYPDSWLGDTEKDLITLDRTLEASGRIDVALTRIDKINVGGFGAIASLIGAIDDIAGKHTEVGITEVVAITANEDRVPVNGIATKVDFEDELKPEIGYIDLNASLNIFPNPTSSEVLITTRFNYPIEKIRVLDGYGNPTGLQVVGKNRIDLNELPSGIYMLRIQLGKYTISRKVVKVN